MTPRPATAPQDPLHCCVVGEDADFAYIHCTQDGFKTVQQTLVDSVEGAGAEERRGIAGAHERPPSLLRSPR